MQKVYINAQPAQIFFKHHNYNEVMNGSRTYTEITVEKCLNHCYPLFVHQTFFLSLPAKKLSRMIPRANQ